MGLVSVEPQSESTFIWDPDFLQSPDGWKLVKNDKAYNGFLLYITGNPQSRAGGGPSALAFQHDASGELPLRRSGHVAIGPVSQGPGFLFTMGDDEWFKFKYFTGLPVELLSVAQHEIGHALFFHADYPVVKKWLRDGTVGEAAVVNYQGAVLSIDSSVHFPTEIDAASLRGITGSQRRVMPQHRWITTKAELLMARAIGYKIRDFETAL